MVTGFDINSFNEEIKRKNVFCSYAKSLKEEYDILDKESIRKCLQFYSNYSGRAFVNQRRRLLFVFIISTGIKMKSALNLKIKDVLDENFIIKPYIDLRKNDKDVLDIFPINPILAEYIYSYLDTKIDFRYNNYLFQSERGHNEPVSRTKVYEDLRLLYDVLDDSFHISIETLRKTHNYWITYINSNKELGKVSQYLIKGSYDKNKNEEFISKFSISQLFACYDNLKYLFTEDLFEPVISVDFYDNYPKNTLHLYKSNKFKISGFIYNRSIFLPSNIDNNQWTIYKDTKNVPYVYNFIEEIHSIKYRWNDISLESPMTKCLFQYEIEPISDEYNYSNGVCTISRFVSNKSRNIWNFKLYTLQNHPSLNNHRYVDSNLGTLFCREINSRFFWSTSDIKINLFKNKFIYDIFKNSIRNINNDNNLYIQNYENIEYIGCYNYIILKIISLSRIYKSGAYHIIPQGVTTIGREQFKNTIGLENVFIPNTVKRIEYQAFAKCCSLKSLSIPNSVYEIQSGAFYRCGSLKNINMTNKLLELNEDTFKSCYSLEKLSFYYGLAYADLSSFFECNRLKYCKLPTSVVNLYENIKYYESVEYQEDYIIISNNNQDKDNYGANWRDNTPHCIYFRNCPYSNSIIYIEKQNVFIEQCSFLDNKSINELIIKTKNVFISPFSFTNCVNLLMIELQANHTYIGSYAFCNCLGLKQITITSDVISINNNAFKNCISLEEVVIIGTLYRIEKHTFNNCRNLQTIRIPDSVKYINPTAFSNCNNLKIICSLNSYAHNYAIKNKFKFQIK